MTETHRSPWHGGPLIVGGLLMAATKWIGRAPIMDEPMNSVAEVLSLLALLFLAVGIVRLARQEPFGVGRGRAGLLIALFATVSLGLAWLIAVELDQVVVGSLFLVFGTLAMPLGMLSTGLVGWRAGRSAALSTIFLLVGLLAGPVAIVLEFNGPFRDGGWHLWGIAISFGWILIGLLVAAGRSGAAATNGAHGSRFNDAEIA